jgi:general stress protein 26
VTRTEIVELLRHHKLAVIASLADDGSPQAALVGVAVSEQLEIVLDTLTSTRKFHNIVRDGRVALVIGEGELTIQIEGHADVPGGADLERLHEVYFAAFADGRNRMTWPDIAWLRVRPTWIRVADYAADPPVIREQHL